MQIKDVVVIAKLDRREFWNYSRQAHRHQVQKILKYLTQRGIRYRLKDRLSLTRYAKAKLRTDLAISIGGDGTLLAASHYICASVPFLGVNSAPNRSVGFFCKATPKTFIKTFNQILEDRIKPKPIPRLRVFINKRLLPIEPLNEVLLAGDSAADTSRYIIKWGKKQESQKSSGIWIATGAGSTGAILSAGGNKQSITSRNLQFIVREPFQFPQLDYQILKGTIRPRQSLRVIPYSSHTRLYIDGGIFDEPVAARKKITFKGDGTPLLLFK